jgi:hypothetical protein
MARLVPASHEHAYIAVRMGHRDEPGMMIYLLENSMNQ